MATENARNFLKSIESDEALLEQIRKMEPEEIVQLARERGFDVTATELEAAAKQQRTPSAEEVRELDLDEMDNAAGGWLFYGDDAKDGHEMGCTLSYHGMEWSIENHEWCRYEYYYSINVRISKGKIIYDYGY